MRFVGLESLAGFRWQVAVAVEDKAAQINFHDLLCRSRILAVAHWGSIPRTHLSEQCLFVSGVIMARRLSRIIASIRGRNQLRWLVPCFALLRLSVLCSSRSF